MKIKFIYLVFFIGYSSVLHAGGYRYDIDSNLYNFKNDTAVLYEWNNYKPKGEIDSYIYKIDFKQNSISVLQQATREIGYSIAVDSDFNYVFICQHQIDAKAQIYNFLDNQAFATKHGHCFHPFWNDKTQRFNFREYVQAEKRHLFHEYDFNSNEFIVVDEPAEKYPITEVGTYQSEGEYFIRGYKINYHGDEDGQYWVINNSENESFEVEAGKSYRNEALIWNLDSSGFWLFPHNTYVDIANKKSINFLIERDWRDIAHDDKSVFVHDEKKDEFHIVDVNTQKIIKTYQPFWREKYIPSPPKPKVFPKYFNSPREKLAYEQEQARLAEEASKSAEQLLKQEKPLTKQTSNLDKAQLQIQSRIDIDKHKDAVKLTEKSPSLKEADKPKTDKVNKTSLYKYWDIALGILGIVLLTILSLTFRKKK